MISEKQKSYSMWDYCVSGVSLFFVGGVAATVAYLAKSTFETQNRAYELSSGTQNDLFFQRHLTSLSQEGRRVFDPYYPYIPTSSLPFPTNFDEVRVDCVNEAFLIQKCTGSIEEAITLCDATTSFSNLNLRITGQNNRSLPQGMTVLEYSDLGNYRYYFFNLSKTLSSYGVTPFEFRAVNQGGNTTVFPFTIDLLRYSDTFPQRGPSFPNEVNYVAKGAAYSLFIGKTAAYVYSPFNDYMTFSASVRSLDLSPRLSYSSQLNGYTVEGVMGDEPVYLDLTVTAENSCGDLVKTFTVSILEENERPDDTGGLPPEDSSSSSSSAALIGGSVVGGVVAIGGAVLLAKKNNFSLFKRNQSLENEMSRV
jgi:hypothetical protein